MLGQLNPPSDPLRVLVNAAQAQRRHRPLLTWQPDLFFSTVRCHYNIGAYTAAPIASDNALKRGLSSQHRYSTLSGL